MIEKENLPKNWKLVKIEDIAHTITDYVANGSFASLRENVKYKEKEDHAILIRLKDYSKKFKEPFVYIDQHAYDFLSKTKLKNNDLILSNVGARLGTVFRVPNLNKPMSLGPNAILIRTNDSDDYLNYWLRSTFGQKSIFNIRSESAQPKFNKTSLRKIKIPVPPLETQKKIVKIFEKAEKLKEWRTEADELLDEYLKSLFYEMFGNPIRNSKNLKLSFLKDVADINMGQSPPGDSYNDKKRGMEFFQGKSEFTDKYPIVKKWTTKPLKLAKKNDILMSVRAPVGSVNIANIDCCIGRGLAAISCKKDINRDYLYSFFKIIEENIANMGSGSTFKAITKTQLNNLQILIPPISLQNQFAQIVQQVETLKNHQSKSKQEIDNLFNTLMQKAFKGELVC